MSNADWERYKQQLTQAAIAGLDAGAPIFEREALANARAQMRGQTGATFAGIYAAVDSADSSGIVAQAVAAVEERNPAHAHTEDAERPPNGVVRLVGSVPTDYIGELEARPDKRFLSTTLDSVGGDLHAALEGELRKVV